VLALYLLFLYVVFRPRRSRRLVVTRRL